MKRNILFFVATMFGLQIQAQQQIVNGNMESWDNLGTANEEPTNWNSLKSATGTMSAFGQQQIWRSSSVRPGSSGTYSAQIKSVSVLGVTANGTVTLGTVNMGSSTATSPNNYNYSQTAKTDFSESFTDQPDSIVFWVKYTPINSAHQARMSVVLHDTYDYKDGYNVDANSTPHTVATATKDIDYTNGLWKRIAVKINYGGPAVNNTHLLVTFSTNKTPGVGSVNDEVLIDDVELIYNSTLGVDLEKQAIYKPSVFDGNLCFFHDLQGEYSIFTTSGSLVKKGEIEPKISVESIHGLHIVQMKLQNGVHSYKMFF